MGRFVPNPSGIQRLRFAPDEVCHRDLTRRLLNVEGGSKRRCPVNYGRLRASIRHGIRKWSRGLIGTVGSDVEYAEPVHEGYRRKLKNGGVRIVEGRPFLRDALPKALD